MTQENPRFLYDPAVRSALDGAKIDIGNPLGAVVTELQERIIKALDLIVRYGGIDGAHHKAWVLDQAVRILAADKYEQIVRDAKAGADGPNTYEWEDGVAP